jgi:hypothetical protein
LCSWCSGDFGPTVGYDGGFDVVVHILTFSAALRRPWVTRPGLGTRRHTWYSLAPWEVLYQATTELRTVWRAGVLRRRETGAVRGTEPCHHPGISGYSTQHRGGPIWSLGRTTTAGYWIGKRYCTTPLVILPFIYLFICYLRNGISLREGQTYEAYNQGRDCPSYL